MNFEMCSKHLCIVCIKAAGSLTTSKSIAGWESDNFKILLAGNEERVFFPVTSTPWFRSPVIYQSARLNTKNYCMAGP